MNHVLHKHLWSKGSYESINKDEGEGLMPKPVPESPVCGSALPPGHVRLQRVLLRLHTLPCLL